MYINETNHISENEININRVKTAVNDIMETIMAIEVEKHALTIADVTALAEQTFRNAEFEDFCIKHNTNVDAEINEAVTETMKITESIVGISSAAKAVIKRKIRAFSNPIFTEEIKAMCFKFMDEVIDRA